MIVREILDAGAYGFVSEQAREKSVMLWRRSLSSGFGCILHGLRAVFHDDRTGGHGLCADRLLGPGDTTWREDETG